MAAPTPVSAYLHAAASEQLLTSAHDLADGGLGQSLAESVLRFGLGARVVH
ncbi:hypothetical protein IAE22_31385 [Bacillus sp. S34]|nr:hypothetical protein [Bacillus sp. S34]